MLSQIIDHLAKRKIDLSDYDFSWCPGETLRITFWDNPKSKDSNLIRRRQALKRAFVFEAKGSEGYRYLHAREQIPVLVDCPRCEAEGNAGDCPDCNDAGFTTQNVTLSVTIEGSIKCEIVRTTTEIRRLSDYEKQRLEARLSEIQAALDAGSEEVQRHVWSCDET